MHRRISLLGVPIDVVTRAEALGLLADLAQSSKQHHVMTPNPEMLVLASKTPSFHALLQRTSLNLPDGVGLLFAAKVFGTRIPERVTGVDVLTDLCALENVGSVFFLGAAPGVSDRASQILQKKYPSLRIAGTFSGSPRPEEEAEIVERISASGASVLFVAYGAPEQDLWIDRNLSKLPSVRLAMGVGGAFDFIAGVQKRAPQWMRGLGLEWSYRLFKEPCRLRRILTAVVLFPWLIIRAKIGALSTRDGASRT